MKKTKFPTYPRPVKKYFNPSLSAIFVNDVKKKKKKANTEYQSRRDVTEQTDFEEVV